MIDFGELRSVFADKPSPQGWARIVEALDQAHAQKLRPVLPYLNAHLERWPAPLLEAPLDWLARATGGEDVPQLMLAKRLDASMLLPQDLAALAKRRLLDGLVILSARDCGLQTQDLKYWLSALEHVRPQTLDLSENYLRDDALRLLAKSLVASGLRELILERHALGDSGFHILANSPNLRGLERLALSHGDINATQARALASATHLPALRSLSLHEVSFGADAFKGFCFDGALTQQLETLELSDSQLRWGEFVFLGRQALPSMKTLSLSGLQLDGVDQEYVWPWPPDAFFNRGAFLESVPEMPRLERLAMANIQGDIDRIVGAIHGSRHARIRWGYLGALRALDLRQNTLSNASIRHLCEDLNFGQLQALELDEARLSTAQVEMLARSLVLPEHITSHWASILEQRHA